MNDTLKKISKTRLQKILAQLKWYKPRETTDALKEAILAISKLEERLKAVDGQIGHLSETINEYRVRIVPSTEDCTESTKTEPRHRDWEIETPNNSSEMFP